MGGLCLLVQLHRNGCAMNGATVGLWKESRYPEPAAVPFNIQLTQQNNQVLQYRFIMNWHIMSGNIGHAAVYYLFQKQENNYKKKMKKITPTPYPLQITQLHHLNGNIKLIPAK